MGHTSTEDPFGIVAGCVFQMLGFNIGALIIRVGFGGPLYYNYNKDPPKHSIGSS